MWCMSLCASLIYLTQWPRSSVTLRQSRDFLSLKGWPALHCSHVTQTSPICPLMNTHGLTPAAGFCAFCYTEYGKRDVSLMHQSPVLQMYGQMWNRWATLLFLSLQIASTLFHNYFASSYSQPIMHKDRLFHQFIDMCSLSSFW